MMYARELGDLFSTITSTQEIEGTPVSMEEVQQMIDVAEMRALDETLNLNHPDWEEAFIPESLSQRNPSGKCRFFLKAVILTVICRCRISGRASCFHGFLFLSFVENQPGFESTPTSLQKLAGDCEVASILVRLLTAYKNEGLFLEVLQRLRGSAFVTGSRECLEIKQLKTIIRYYHHNPTETFQDLWLLDVLLNNEEIQDKVVAMTNEDVDLAVMDWVEDEDLTDSLLRFTPKDWTQNEGANLASMNRSEDDNMMDLLQSIRNDEVFQHSDCSIPLNAMDLAQILK